jgi:hypothetical protein
LRHELQKVDAAAVRHELTEADFVDGVLKVTPLTSAVPEEAEALIPGIRAIASRQSHRLSFSLIAAVAGSTTL